MNHLISLIIETVTGAAKCLKAWAHNIQQVTARRFKQSKVHIKWQRKNNNTHHFRIPRWKGRNWAETARAGYIVGRTCNTRCQACQVITGMQIGIQQTEELGYIIAWWDQQGDLEESLKEKLTTLSVTAFQCSSFITYLSICHLSTTLKIYKIYLNLSYKFSQFSSSAFSAQPMWDLLEFLKKLNLQLASDI